MDNFVYLDAKPSSLRAKFAAGTAACIGALQNGGLEFSGVSKISRDIPVAILVHSAMPR